MHSISNSELQLFVFEGSRAESKYVEQLERNFLGKRISVKCVYDAHSTLADDGKIEEMLEFFDNETENGLLYISYPMVEAIRHYKDLDSFKDLTVKCKRANCTYKEECEDVEACLAEPHYKQFSASDCRQDLCNINKYTNDVWQELIYAHVAKMNYLVNGAFAYPEKMESQCDIFDKQLEKYVNHKCPMVAVLSAFPIYVLDYYGVETLKKKLERVLPSKR